MIATASASKHMRYARYHKYREYRLDYVFVLPVHKKPATYGEGRVCSHCGTILTIYNPNPMCFSFTKGLMDAGMKWLEDVKKKKLQAIADKKNDLELLKIFKRLGKKEVVYARRSRRPRTWKNRLYDPISPVDMFN